MEKKTADPAKYMREWKKKKYDADPSKVKLQNKNYYYKDKFGLTKDEIELFGENTKDCALVIFHLGVLRERRPDLYIQILDRFKE
jgi:hypothetical protein